MVGIALTARRRTLLIRGLLLAVSLPGLVLLLGDLLRPSPRAVARRVGDWRVLAERYGEEFGLSPALVLAVIAVESKGAPDARSSRGAVGLMQLMPATAREVARFLDRPEPDPRALEDPETNVRLGCAYLREQLDNFGQDVRLALAAYHAGPGRVTGWLTDHPDLAPEEILARVAFPVTKSYVEDVLQYRSLTAKELRR